jgi:hypothetical protein
MRVDVLDEVSYPASGAAASGSFRAILERTPICAMSRGRFPGCGVFRRGIEIITEGVDVATKPFGHQPA